MKGFMATFNRINLVTRIVIGLIIGIIIALISPEAGKAISIFGSVFVGALKAVAPLLVFVLVISALANQRAGEQNNAAGVLKLYAIGTFGAALTAVLFSFLFPINLPGLQEMAASGDVKPPSGIGEVMGNLLMSFVANPVRALMEANYIGVLAWAAMIGVALRKHATQPTLNFFNEASEAISTVVTWIINFAPLGIMGLVAASIAESGFGAMKVYGQLLAVLLGCMAFIALVFNPLVVWWQLRRNPYPLVLTCLKESGITAFFTRSSAANIPVNLALCERLGVNEDTYTMSIPLGSTINMAGAAITINVMALAAAHTLGITVDLPTALLLAFVGGISAAGASGVAGGSLLLIPVACSLFGISADIAAKVVGIGFIIGVIQDSAETAINSSTDALFTITADYAKRPNELPPMNTPGPSAASD